MIGTATGSLRKQNGINGWEGMGGGQGEGVGWGGEGVGNGRDLGPVVNNPGI